MDYVDSSSSDPLTHFCHFCELSAGEDYSSPPAPGSSPLATALVSLLLVEVSLRSDALLPDADALAADSKGEMLATPGVLSIGVRTAKSVRACGRPGTDRCTNDA